MSTLFGVDDLVLKAEGKRVDWSRPGRGAALRHAARGRGRVAAAARRARRQRRIEAQARGPCHRRDALRARRGRRAPARAAGGGGGRRARARRALGRQRAAVRHRAATRSASSGASAASPRTPSCSSRPAARRRCARCSPSGAGAGSSPSSPTRCSRSTRATRSGWRSRTARPSAASRALAPDGHRARRRTTRASTRSPRRSRRSSTRSRRTRHATRTASRCTPATIGAELGFSPAVLRDLRRGALLHDLGKLGISNTILDKPGKLDDNEFALIRSHPVFTEQILSRVPAFAPLAAAAAAHHERLDGRGYPYGLRGSELTPYSRVLAVVRRLRGADRRPALPRGHAGRRGARDHAPRRGRAPLPGHARALERGLQVRAAARGLTVRPRSTAPTG